MNPITRRDFIKAGGALVVSCGTAGTVTTALSQVPQTVGGKPALTPDELDSWIAVLPDGSVKAFFGKMDMGQGVDVAIGQIVAEELDVVFEKVTVVSDSFTVRVLGMGQSISQSNGVQSDIAVHLTAVLDRTTGRCRIRRLRQDN